MKVGEYIRTNCYGIQRITGFISDLENDYIDCDYDETTICLINKKEIIKYSPNIIDLIEVGDYVNGCMVINKKDDTIQIVQLIIPFNLKEKDIKSIVTKEQFESMEYKVGD